MIETAACTTRTKTRKFIVLDTYHAASSRDLHESVNVEMDKRTQFALQDFFRWGKVHTQCTIMHVSVRRSPIDRSPVFATSLN